MDKSEKYMKISELAKTAGIPVEVIRRYIKKEILPKPVKINKTAALYTNQHLKRLKLIMKLEKDNKLPIAVIKEMIKSIVEIEGSGASLQSENPSLVREQLVDCSIDVFRKKGYEGTTITDIVAAAGIARRTFYRYFQSKEELFIECLNAIFFKWIKQEPRNDFQASSKSICRNRLNKMFVSGYKAYPRWIDMLNLLRAAAVKNPKTFDDKLFNSLEMRIKPIIHDINACINKGIFRKVNAELLAIMLAGMFEYVCYFIYKGRFTQEAHDVSDQTLDMLFNGILARGSNDITVDAVNSERKIR